jgi:DNA-binding NtrC family response regulator
LITGPTDTGKELIARSIHAHSARADRPLVPFRCSHLRYPLNACQLFGHVAGHGILTRHAALGCCLAAEGGTLLLDEVGDLDATAQQLLLHVIKEKRVTPVGGEVGRSVNLRIMATSSKDLTSEVRSGRFSFELLYRLNALTVTAAPLRERRDDILPLARHLMARITLENGLPLKRLTPAALALIEAYDWPGNVTELEAELERVVVESAGESVLDVDAFSRIFERIHSAKAEDSPTATWEMSEPANALERIPPSTVVEGHWPSLAEVEAEHLRSTLEAARYNLTVAARMLKVDVDDLRTRLRRHEIRLSLPRRSTPL